MACGPSTPSVARTCPDIDLDAEVAWVERGEIEDVEGVAPIPGAVDFLKRLPPDRWAVVTSASVPLARARLKAAGVTPPVVLITAEDVERGKPDPAGYLKAAAALGVDIADCLVFEDAEAGIAAGEAAGAGCGGGDGRLDASAGDGPTRRFRTMRRWSLRSHRMDL